MNGLSDLDEPDVQAGIQYWNTQPATYDGVLGGYGTGSLPRIDSLGSRQFLQHLIPELCTVPSALQPLTQRTSSAPAPTHRTRALDVGAGIGRVTADALLHLLSDVVLLEPVDNFVNESLRRARASTLTGPDAPPEHLRWKGLQDRSRSVTVLQGTLQAFNPSRPTYTSTLLGRVGYAPSAEGDDDESGFDVIWCQWCLGHMSDADLVAFFQRCQGALRAKGVGIGRSVIVVKENLCRDTWEGGARAMFDGQDSSLTRSDLMWKELFEEAGLRLVAEKVQLGLPEELYTVKMYALR